MPKEVSAKVSLAKESEYFEKKNQEALSRLSKNKGEEVRMSPIDGSPMEKIVLHGVVVDRCTTSGGIWLDGGELEEILEQLKPGAPEEERSGWVESFFKSLQGHGHK